MAFYSQTFWLSLQMQQLGGLSPLEVAVRLLPQAVVGLVISPLVGLVMHRVNGTVLLGVSCAALVISNLLLSMSHTRDSYFAWAFPSLILSTLGMDWTLNVGSLHILACLPFSQHSIGISLLQATTRLAIPVGIAVTTSVWSSFDGSVDVPRLQSAYTNTFVTTTALAGMALALVPFIRIGKQDEDWAYGAAPRNANSSRANRSPVCETSSVLVEKRPDRSPPRLSMMSSDDTTGGRWWMSTKQDGERPRVASSTFLEIHLECPGLGINLYTLYINHLPSRGCLSC